MSERKRWTVEVKTPMWENKPQLNGRAKFDAKVRAMMKMAEQVEINRVYMITTTERFEPRTTHVSTSTYVVSVLAQELLTNDPQPASTAHLDEGIGRTEV